jgi:hypothetical protein
MYYLLKFKRRKHLYVEGGESYYHEELDNKSDVHSQAIPNKKSEF